MEKREDAAAGLSTSGHHRPDAFEPTLAGGAACPLCHLAIDHHETNRLLRQIVRWLDSGCRDKLKISLAVLGELSPNGVETVFCATRDTPN